MKERILLIYSRIEKDVKNNRTGILAFAGIFLLFFVFFGEVCPSQILFGFPCPGCGLTRAGILVLQIKPEEAWQMHPFIYAWILLALYICYKRYIKGTVVKGLIPLVIGITIAMLAFYIYRLCRYYPEVEPMIRQSGSVYHACKKLLDTLTY